MITDNDELFDLMIEIYREDNNYTPRNLRIFEEYILSSNEYDFNKCNYEKVIEMLLNYAKCFYTYDEKYIYVTAALRTAISMFKGSFYMKPAGEIHLKRLDFIFDNFLQKDQYDKIKICVLKMLFRCVYHNPPNDYDKLFYNKYSEKLIELMKYMMNNTIQIQVLTLLPWYNYDIRQNNLLDKLEIYQKKIILRKLKEADLESQKFCNYPPAISVNRLACIDIIEYLEKEIKGETK